MGLVERVTWRLATVPYGRITARHPEVAQNSKTWSFKGVREYMQDHVEDYSPDFPMSMT